MKSPMQLFYLDNKYVYAGQRTTRGVLCDVYNGYRQLTNYGLGGTTINATFEYYFLSRDYTEWPVDGAANAQSVPFMLEVTGVDEGYHVIYNFMDFDEEPVDISVFDVSACYPESSKLQFQVRFPGQYKRDKDDYMRTTSQRALATIMGVTPLRVQDVYTEYDNSHVFISATLLDRSPYIAQFTQLVHYEVLLHDDFVVPYTPSPTVCAKECVTLNLFICNSFVYCSALKECRLSRIRNGDGLKTAINSTCDHYTRTVKVPGIEKRLDVAFYALQLSIWSGKLTMIVPMDDGTTTTYTAVDVTVRFGYLQTKAEPTITGQFSYQQEIVIPSLQQVYDAGVWYDFDYQLVRYDVTNPNVQPPFYTTNPMTYIHDFNTGLAYNLDKTLGNCTISPIDSGKFDDVSKQLMNGVTVAKMKNPLDIFYMNGSYKYAGQRTVRGMLADVFETTRSDSSIFQLYFLSDGWAQLSSTSANAVNSQPIRMDVSSEQVFMSYNFYNFNEEHPDLSNFDIRTCFDGSEEFHFMITFPGQYHPWLDSNHNFFLKRAQLLLVQSTGASPLRFQDAELSYNSNSVLLFATMIGQAPAIGHVNNTAPVELSVNMAMKKLKDVIYKSLFYITVQIKNQTQTFKAKTFEKIIRPGRQISTRSSTQGQIQTQPSSIGQQQASTGISSDPRSVAAFSASLTSDKMFVGDQQTIIFDHVVTNTGNCYHRYTGIFQAHTCGMYFFSVSVRSTTNHYINVEIVHNDKILCHAHGDSSTNNGQGGCTAVVQLGDGDDVWVRHLGTEGNTIRGDHYNVFSGGMFRAC